VALGGTLQVFLPGWVRARGLAIYQMVFAGGQALAALAWGVLAELVGIVPTLLAAAALLVLGALSVLAWPLRDTAGWDRDLAVYWPEPHLELEPELENGPIIVIITYAVPPSRAPDFLAAMVPVRRMRLRTGAQKLDPAPRRRRTRQLRRDRQLPDLGRAPAPAQPGGSPAKTAPSTTPPQPWPMAHPAYSTCSHRDTEAQLLPLDRAGRRGPTAPRTRR
jgi:hypothetical protein